MVPFNPGTNSKRQRLEIAANYISTGAVRFVKNDKTKYLIQRLIDFPFVDHDDIVDACSQLILYHFTQRKQGVYTKCFTYENIIKLETLKEPYDARNDIYGVTINTDLIKVCRMNIRNDKYVVEQEWQIAGLEKFEDFYINNFRAMPIMLDCSYENTLYKLIKNPNIILTPFDDNRREESIHSLKVGFYKKKILVSKDCPQTINDISKLRLTDTSVAKGQQVVSTYDEGLAGCVRCLAQYYHGTDNIW
jgi:hypothetical protein